VSGGVVLRESLRQLVGCELPDPARRAVTAVVRSHPAEPRQLLYEAALEAGHPREVLLGRACAAYLLYCAGHLADDLIDGDCAYLADPAREGPAAQYLLCSLAYAGAATSGVSAASLARVGRHLATAAGRQFVDFATTAFTAPLFADVVEVGSGRHAAALLELLWDGSPLGALAGPVGRPLGVCLQAGGDAVRGDRRFTSLPADDQRAVRVWLDRAADELAGFGLRFLGAYVEALRGALAAHARGVERVGDEGPRPGR
jgi:hypothetical protein